MRGRKQHYLVVVRFRKLWFTVCCCFKVIFVVSFSEVAVYSVLLFFKVYNLISARKTIKDL